MPNSTLQTLRRYQSISVFGGGIIVTILILLASGLGMTWIVYTYAEGERRTYLNGLEQTMNAIQVSETSFRNSVSNVQLIWREVGNAPASMLGDFFRSGQQFATKPYSSLVLGVPEQTTNRVEVARYLSMSALLARICAASSINRGHTLEGYHYSTRTGAFALVPNRQHDYPALDSPEGRARVFDALRIQFGEPSRSADEARPQVRWLPPFIDPVTGQSRIRIAAEAHDHGKPFAVLVTEYSPEYLLSWLDNYRRAGVFYITTSDGGVVSMDPRVVGSNERVQYLLQLNRMQDDTSPGAPMLSGGFLLFRDHLGSTGWSLTYALSWGDIVRGVAWPAGTVAAATLAALAVMWTLLLRFHRREFVPLYVRSQRVFDSEALCRSVIEMAPIGLGLIARDDEHFMLASPALKEMVERIGGEYHVLSSQVVGAWQVGDADCEVLAGDILLPGVEAANPHIEFMVCGGRYQGRDVLITVFADVTAKRQLFQKLEEAVRAADSANAAKSSFLAAMSHEIRTPLNVVLGNLELLERSALDASQHGRIRALRTSATNLLAIVSDILDFSKIEAGSMSVESIEFDVIAMIERELDAFSLVAKEKGVQLFCEINASVAQRMRGDPTRLAQIFGNLLSNAIKFTSAGSITSRVSVAVDGRDASEIVFEVEDTGIGIAAEHLVKLFRPFSQVDMSITRRFGGTGLGLALCDRLVTAMGGRISVESEPGVGSCFTVRLPLGVDVSKFDARRATNGRTLTLVATHPEWRDFVLPHLKSWGFDVRIQDGPLDVQHHGIDRLGTVILVGDPDMWPHVDLDGVYSWTILATRDGPLEPYYTGNVVRVSCYSLCGLYLTLMQSDHGGPEVGRDFPMESPSRRLEASAHYAIGGSLRVLVADDRVLHGSLLSEQFQALGCTGFEVDSAQAALDSLATGTWDVLMIGADLPDMSALALAETVRDREFACDVLVVTSHMLPDEKRRYVQAGVHRVLTKPVTLAHLHVALAKRRWNTGSHRLRGANLPPERVDSEKVSRNK
ncbi:histidine kinase [Burkholderia cepacia]|uniref:Virulence sensor protein BvgS n=1 Tax=Burkholderia cepacia TaxID=292 RepID=A0A0J5ZAV0_BURCE|nr:ATP-binding protein [Burkholderia cepacia]KML46878.1 histidine kinase [Burkholderia cepacia]